MIEFEMLSEDNIREVWELEKRCFDDPWTYNMFESELDNRISVYIVGRDIDSGAVAAYGGVWMMYDSADITNVAVAPEYRREGLGSEILRLLAKVCTERGIKTVNLEVKASNSAALALYEKFGFVRCGLRKKYYHNTDDAVLMCMETNEISD